MDSFNGFGLFDPNCQDEDMEEDIFLSASELMEKRKMQGMARSPTSLDLKRPSSPPPVPGVPRSHTCLNLKSLNKSPTSEARRVGRSRTFSAPVDDDYIYLPPEPQNGNIEYKLKLVKPSSQRLEHLVTQMKWRLREGNGEAIYEMGVEDDGMMTGLSEEDMDDSLETLQEMARRLGATVQVLRQRKIPSGINFRTVAEILVRKVPEDQQVIDLSVCVLGSADTGKSTLLGVLTGGELDNGRGRARLNMFRHLHEIQSGRTSSVSHGILGFDNTGAPVDYREHSTAEEICEKASKLITLIDLAGHQKYLRTTISALTGYSPHYVMLVVSGSGGVVGMTQEHLGIAVALEVPFFVVITKVDVTPPTQLANTMESVKGILKAAGSNKVPLVVESGDDCITAASTSLTNNAVPIFKVSSVSGVGLPLVRQFLHLLPPGVCTKEAGRLEQEIPEFQIDELFHVPGVGTVAGGLVTQGIIVENMPLKVGPFDNGSFREVTVSSIRRNRAPCRLVRAQQSAALALNIPLNHLRRGMVATGREGEEPVACQYFQAKVCLLFHPTEIFEGFRTTVHCGNIRQTAVIEGISPIKGMKSSDQASVMFKFIKNPEFVKLGARILFREGRTKGIGKVTQVFPFKQEIDR